MDINYPPASKFGANLASACGLTPSAMCGRSPQLLQLSNDALSRSLRPKEKAGWRA